MKRRAINRVVLAYSGGLNSSVAIPWLIDQRHVEVIAVTLDLGQECDLSDVRERALAAGATRAHVIDAREAFARDFVLPALQAGVRCDGRVPLAPALGCPLIARRLVDVARMERASAIAHGEIDEQNGSRLNVLIRSLDASLALLAPLEICEQPLSDKLKYARTNRIPVPGFEAHVIDSNLWGRSVRVRTGLDPDVPQAIFARTRSIADCPDEPAYIEIEFEAAVPVRANRIDMTLVELLESVEVIAGVHGVGRVIPSHRDAHKRPPELNESPAAIVLHAAYGALERVVLSREVLRLKGRLGRLYGSLIRDGLWFSEKRAAIDAFVRTLQPQVTGSVVLKLFKGACVVSAVNPSTAHPDAPPSNAAVEWARAGQGLIS